MSTRTDVVVVGARCAGGALATFLARAGVRVVAVDRAPLPSDQVMSTHTIHPPGVDVLEELGVADAVREVTPRTRRMCLRKGTGQAVIALPDGRHELCPRRERLDGLIQAAAAEAGAEVRGRTRATRVLFDEGRAVGVEVERNGSTETVRADVVVGADGRRSFVAEQVGAGEYLGYDAPRAMYWAYWDAPDAWWTDEYPFDMYLEKLGPDARVVFQTDHDQLLVGALPPTQVALSSWRSDAPGALKACLADGPVTGPLLGDRDPATSVRGTVKERYYFRRAAGPGWALVGDAGHHKEFIVGDGITEALIQAKNLSAAIVEGGDGARERWWRARDVRALPGWFWGRDEGVLDPPGELESRIVERIARDEGLQRRVARLIEHQVSPYDAVPPTAVLPALAGALSRGRVGVVSELVTQARRAAAFRKEMAERVRLLDEVGGAPAATAT